MRIYVAASSKEWRRARFFIASLRLAGHTVDHDWTETIERDLMEGGDAALHPEVRKSVAESCFLAARDCEWFVRLIGPDMSEGAPFEHGVAASATRHVILVGSKDDLARSVMTEMSDDVFATDAEALKWIGCER